MKRHTVVAVVLSISVLLRANAGQAEPQIVVRPESPTNAGVSAMGPDSRGLSPERDPDKEHWIANFQSTYIWQKKPAFYARYTGANSLVPSSELGYTLTATLFFGFRPWNNTEFYFNPEITQSQSLSHMAGLGGLSNSENQKGGGPVPKLYSARAFLRQTIILSKDPSSIESSQNRFSGEVANRRLVITIGQFGLIDVFDNNSLAHDGRTQFINWALLTHGAFDFAADTRGYTWGLAVEYYHDDWAFRAGRFAQPKESNGMTIDFDIIAHQGDNLEVEHDHRIFGQDGKVRLLGFRNVARMGSFREALDYARLNGGIPSVADVRHNQAKYGAGLSLEQNLSRDTGIFVRASWNDGQTETYAFAEIERSLSAGSAMKGRLWRRPDDVIALAVVQNGLSAAHRDYLAAGGLGFIIGDGRIRYQPERILEAYYSLNAFKGLWMTFDIQHVKNPAYNADRGPVDMFGCRVHAEF